MPTNCSGSVEQGHARSSDITRGDAAAVRELAHPLTRSHARASSGLPSVSEVDSDDRVARCARQPVSRRQRDLTADLPDSKSDVGFRVPPLWVTRAPRDDHARMPDRPQVARHVGRHVTRHSHVTPRALLLVGGPSRKTPICGICGTAGRGGLYRYNPPDGDKPLSNSIEVTAEAPSAFWQEPTGTSSHAALRDGPISQLPRRLHHDSWLVATLLPPPGDGRDK